MREFGLIAVSTMFQPKARHNSATYLNVEPDKAPFQIDYILMSRRWSSGVSNCLVKWGISMDRWGRKYDHGLLKLTWKARLRCDKRMPKMDTDLLLKDGDI